MVLPVVTIVLVLLVGMLIGAYLALVTVSKELETDAIKEFTHLCKTRRRKEDINERGNT